MDRNSLRSILSESKVGIVGAGGLGSNCAASLVRAGLKSLIIADYDRVSESNLDRQFYFYRQIGRLKVEALAENLKAIDPGLKLEAIDARIDAENLPGIFSGCDVVVEAVDDAATKEMIIETVLSLLPETPIVAASGLAGTGFLDRLTIIDGGLLHICGDFEHEVSAEDPPFAPRVTIVANMEADAVLRILAGRAAAPCGLASPRA
jgi:sulfur carrier protein ThiS adenylyltransferase